MLNTEPRTEDVLQDSALTQFYSRLPAFQNFRELCRPEFYFPLPDEWLIVATDIENSTEAIRNGKYRQVNSIGVASIMAILNAMKPLQIPYFFGGDGAVLCIPPTNLEIVRSALVGVKLLATTEFDLNLRVGIVPVYEVYDAGETVKIGKFYMNEFISQAMFMGNGLAYAEKLVKYDALQRFSLTIDDAQPMADFSGFECRWQDVPSPHGETLALMVQENEAALVKDIYLDVLEMIGSIYGNEETYRPIQVPYLQLKTKRRDLSDEIRIRTTFTDRQFQKKYIRSLPWKNRVGKFLMGYGINTKTSNWAEYKSNLVRNTDFQKFDNILRMVISGNAKQRKQLSDYLEVHYQNGRLFYGMHVAKTALVTCIVSDYNKNHFHFVDGADGGYALAAAEMKEQIRRSQ